MSSLMKTKNRSEWGRDSAAASTGCCAIATCSTDKGLAIACCCTAIGLLTPVVLLQLRVIDDLPDPPGRIFNSRRIVLSKSARKLGIPDGILGIVSYSVTLALLISAQPSRPVVRGVLRGKLLLDGAIAVQKSRSQLKEFGRICSWCLGASLATAGMLHFARKARRAQQIHAV